MSWDFSMEIDAGGDNPIELPYEASYTYNVSKMFYDAFDLEDGIRGLYGKTGAECRLLIEHAIIKFTINRKLYKSWNPENGWGNYDTALRLLNELLSWCDESPKAIMRVT